MPTAFSSFNSDLWSASSLEYINRQGLVSTSIRPNMTAQDMVNDVNTLSNAPVPTERHFFIDESASMAVDDLPFGMIPDPRFSTTITNESEPYMENRQELTERALRYIFKYRKQPDYDDGSWNAQTPIKLYRNKLGDIFIYNSYFGSCLAMIDVNHSVLVSKRDTVFLGILQDFATARGYKLNRPPRFPRLGQLDPCPDLTPHLPELPIS